MYKNDADNKDIYIYIYIRVCVCVCGVLQRGRRYEETVGSTHNFGWVPSDYVETDGLLLSEKKLPLSLAVLRMRTELGSIFFFTRNERAIFSLRIAPPPYCASPSLVADLAFKRLLSM